MEIVGILMNNHGFSNDIRQTEAIRPDSHMGLPAAGQQRRQIARVGRMRSTGGIKMPAGVCIVRSGSPNKNQEPVGS